MHTASTTHGRLTVAQVEAAGASEGLVRLAEGIEDLEDLQSACLRGFAVLSRQVSTAAFMRPHSVTR